MSLSRRQFLVALGAGVVGGTQLERVAGLDGGPSTASTLSARARTATPAPTTPPVTSPIAVPQGAAALSGTSAAAVVDTPAASTATGAANKVATGHLTESAGSSSVVRTPSQAAAEWLEVSDEILAAAEADARSLIQPTRQPRAMAGANLEGWRSVLGDSRHTAAGLATVNGDDIATAHSADRSELVANRHGRGVMAHNTTYLRLVDDDALDMVHEASAYVRTPVTPAQVSGMPNGQTVEMALFVWDGKESRRDIGLALQWVINPWSQNFGALRTWTSSGDGSRWSPDPIAWLDPTDDWQFVEMRLHPTRREASMSINGIDIPAQCTETTKPDNWAYATAAAVSVELISIWPDDRVTAPTTKLECRDWTWDWTVPA